MRHRKKGKKLGRTSAHRKRTLQALSNALIENKRITTTVAKAKALRPFVEPLITRAKEDTQHNRRQVFRHLQNKEAIQELFGDVSQRVGDRPGGYTRIIKLGQRSGDGAELAMIELVDYNDVQPADTGSSSGGTRRGSGKGRRTPEKTEQEGDRTDTADESAGEDPSESFSGENAEPSDEATQTRSDEDPTDEPTDEASDEEQP